MKRSVLTLSALLLFATTVVAQEGNQLTPATSRPYRGLFGSGMEGTSHSLSANLSLGGGYDDNAVRDATQGLRGGRSSDWNTEYQSTLAYASAGLVYSLNWERVSFGANASTMGRYYPQLGDSVFRRDYASVSGSLAIMNGLSVNGFAAYRPYSLSSLFPELEPGEGSDAGVVPEFPFESSFEHFRSYGAGASLSRNLGRRTSVNAAYDYRRSDSSAGLRTFDGQSARLGINYQLTQHLGLGLGYRYQEGSYRGDIGTIRHHDINGGINYNRDFSLLRSRRTTVSFSTGTSLTGRAKETQTDIEDAPGRDRVDDQMRFRVNGTAALRHEFGRSWTGALAYTRNVSITPELPQPVYSDAVVGSLIGLITNRLQFNAGARGTTGRVGRSEDGAFDSYSAFTGLAFFVSRYITSGASYTYYKHNFRNARLLAPGFVPNLDRNSARVYVTLWAPLFSSARRP